MLIEINPHPPLIFKESFTFFESHLEAAKLIIDNSHGNSHIETGSARSSVGNQQSAPHLHPSFKDFFEWQDSVAKVIILEKFKLAKDLDYSVGNSWVNQHGKGGQTLAHSHGTSVLSCVGYISAEEGTGYIEFKDPYYDFRFLHERNDQDLELSEWSVVKIKTGDVLFFPGWMQHRSQINSIDKERWIVSSNYTNFVLKRHLTLGNIGNFS